MYKTALRVLMMGSLVWVGGAAWAKKPAPPPPPKPITTKAPKNCQEQCDLVEKMCTEPCGKMKGSPQAKQACSSQCKQVADACGGSCKEKGKIDDQYIMERIKPPKPPSNVKIQPEDEH